MNSTTCTTIEKARQALDLAADADWSQIRRSYRDMVKVWHPDRFQHDKELCERARRMTVEINLAYEQLEAMREKGESVSKDPRDCAAEKPSCNFRRAGASNNRHGHVTHRKFSWR